MLAASPPAAARRATSALSPPPQPRPAAAACPAPPLRAARRRAAAGVCFSSRQSAKRKERLYGPEDAVPNAPTSGPLPLRDASDGGGFAERDGPESHALALALAAAANDTKAVDISVLGVEKVVSWTRFFVIATCFSRPQVDACVSRMIAAAEAPPLCRQLAHTPAVGSWVCMDFGDVVAHVFTPGDRDFYDLSGYYAKADKVVLPFATQSGA